MKIQILSKNLKLTFLLVLLLGSVIIAGVQSYNFGYVLGSGLIALITLFLAELSAKVKYSLVRGTLIVILCLMFGIAFQSWVGLLIPSLSMDYQPLFSLGLGILTAIVVIKKANAFHKEQQSS